MTRRLPGSVYSHLSFIRTPLDLSLHLVKHAPRGATRSSAMRSSVLLIAVLLSASSVTAQSWGQLEGRISDQSDGSGIPSATVLIEGTSFGTSADANGNYVLRAPEGQYRVRISSIGYTTRHLQVAVRRNESTRLNVELEEQLLELGDVEVTAEQFMEDVGIQRLDARTAQNIPTPLPDGFRALQVLMGVASSTETSYQYSVRGGGYNENQYFINGFEVYTPFRTKQGEQEGLSMVNLDMAESMTLYIGGFPAQYGGKLSSVLAVDYLKPAEGFGGNVYGSALDMGATSYGALFDGKLGLAAGFRRSRPSGFFGSQELQGSYDPIFTDFQGTITYRPAEGHEIHFLGLYLNHRFNLDPHQRRTYFGTFQDLRSVSFAYSGFQQDGYDLGFAGLRISNRLGPAFRMEHDASWFSVNEFEEYEIGGTVALFRLDDVFGNPNDPTNQIGTGAAVQTDYADNRVQVTTLSGSGRYSLTTSRNFTEMGWNGRALRFDDVLNEGTILVGRDIDGLPVDVEQEMRGEAQFDEWQAGGYIQNTYDILEDRSRLLLTGGLRADYTSFNDEWTISPRFSARFKYDDLTTVSAAAGLYHQAPTYRELRGEPIYDSSSDNLIVDAVNFDLRSQRTQMYTIGVERFFPSVHFMGRAEIYYKKLDNLITYNVDHVRTVYSGQNDAFGHTYGFDLQIRGEFVPGLESWLNYGFMVANESFYPEFVNENNHGSVPRPTDRRHNISIFAQDYIPGSDSWRIHIRAIFGTGTPFTAPAPGEVINGVNLQDPGRRNAGRYPEYRRFDMGLTREAEIISSGFGGRPVTVELTGEVLNIFNMTNTIAYSWIAGSDGVWQRIPTRLTPRQANVRLRIRF